MKRNKTMWITSVGIMTAISIVLAEYVKIPMAFLPFGNFLKLEISNLPALLAGFALDPLAGCSVVLLKNVLGMLSTSTGYVGELADFIMSLSFVLPAALLYARMRTRNGALLGMAIGTACSIVVAVPTNYFILLPLFLPRLSGQPFDVTTYLSATIPLFNLIKNGLNCIITFFIYKPLAPVMRHGFRRKQ